MSVLFTIRDLNLSSLLQLWKAGSCVVFRTTKLEGNWMIWMNWCATKQKWWSVYFKNSNNNVKFWCLFPQNKQKSFQRGTESIFYTHRRKHTTITGRDWFSYSVASWKCSKSLTRVGVNKWVSLRGKWAHKTLKFAFSAWQHHTWSSRFSTLDTNIKYLKYLSWMNCNKATWYKILIYQRSIIMLIVVWS